MPFPSTFGLKYHVNKKLPKVDENRSTISFHFWIRNIPPSSVVHIRIYEQHACQTLICVTRNVTPLYNYVVSTNCVNSLVDFTIRVT